MSSLDVGRPFIICGALLCVPASAAPQIPTEPAEMFRALCGVCHGEDGTGQVSNPAIDTAPMDFTDCGVATPEPDGDWELVITRGGPAAGLSSEMPSYGDVLTAAQIQSLVSYVRTFCDEPGWPIGSLNFPRPIFTEKAFPENEVVILPAISHGAEEDVSVRLRGVYEKRFGRRAHGEIGLPLESVSRDGSRHYGLSDITIAGKYVFHTDRNATRIITGGLEVALPTGSEARGLGEGTTVFEPYVAAATLWRDLYLQIQLKLELPTPDPLADETLIYNVFAGRDLSVTLNTWTIGVELNGVSERVAVTPQVRKGLTLTGALAVAAGVRIPINKRDEQRVRWVGYLLWEYLDPVRSAEP